MTDYCQIYFWILFQRGQTSSAKFLGRGKPCKAEFHLGGAEGERVPPPPLRVATIHMHNIHVESSPFTDRKSCLNRMFLTSTWEGTHMYTVPLLHPPLGVEYSHVFLSIVYFLPIDTSNYVQVHVCIHVHVRTILCEHYINRYKNNY